MEKLKHFILACLIAPVIVLAVVLAPIILAVLYTGAGILIIYCLFRIDSEDLDTTDDG